MHVFKAAFLKDLWTQVTTEMSPKSLAKHFNKNYGDYKIINLTPHEAHQ